MTSDTKSIGEQIRHGLAVVFISGFAGLVGIVAFSGSGGSAEDPAAVDRSVVATAIKTITQAVTAAEDVYARTIELPRMVAQGKKTMQDLPDELMSGAEQIQAYSRTLELIDLSRLQNSEAKKALENAVLEFREHYRIKRNYLADTANALQDKNGRLLSVLVQAFAARTDELQGRMVRAMLSLSWAKQAVGLPAELPGFEQTENANSE